MLDQYVVSLVIIQFPPATALSQEIGREGQRTLGAADGARPVLYRLAQHFQHARAEFGQQDSAVSRLPNRQRTTALVGDHLAASPVSAGDQTRIINNSLRLEYTRLDDDWGAARERV